MSHFYGTLEGSTIAPDGTERKTRAARCSTAKEGLRVNLRSNEGSVTVSVFEGEDETGCLEDRVTIRFESCRAFSPTGQGPVVGHNFTLYSGPISECLYEGICVATQESEK